jgi:tetratricopeptide (TPR) repeat protein
MADLDQAIRFDPRKGSRDEVMDHFNKLLRLPPTIAVAYSARGEAYAGKGEYARAIEDYDQALKIHPSLTDAHQNRDRAQAALAATAPQ